MIGRGFRGSGWRFASVVLIGMAFVQWTRGQSIGKRDAFDGQHLEGDVAIHPELTVIPRSPFSSPQVRDGAGNG